MSDTGNDIAGVIEAEAKATAEKAAADEARIAAEAKRLFEQGEAPKAPKPDPAIVDYVEHKWYQPLGAMRTSCFRCGKLSPVIFAPPGVTAFGGPLGRGEVDNTGAVQQEFTNLGWRFEMRRSYCPTCKGLGSTA